MHKTVFFFMFIVMPLCNYGMCKKENRRETFKHKVPSNEKLEIRRQGSGSYKNPDDHEKHFNKWHTNTATARKNTEQGK